MDRRSSSCPTTLLVCLHLALCACVKHPAPAPGLVTPAAKSDADTATDAAPEPNKYSCAANGAAVQDDVERFCVPYAGTPRGDAQALITVVVFSDFECPFCGRVQATLSALEQSYPGKLRFYFRHKPLPFHRNACLAAYAAVAAENQGRFWPMHDRLFDHRTELSKPELIQHAQTLGLDTERFAKDLEAGETQARVEEDLRLSDALSVQGTPSFFINGRLLRGALPVEAFQEVIDDELQRAQAMGMQAASGFSFYAALMEGKGKDKGRPATPEAPTIPVGNEVFNIAVGSVPHKGNKEAKVTLIAFMDFQCPYSARAMKTLDVLTARYPDDLRIAFRHFPLPFHKSAKDAALATMAAEEQGKFWEMAGQLLSHQPDLTTTSIEAGAVSLGLDMTKFRQTVADSRKQARLEQDMKLGERLGVTGTPTFFINGRRFAGAYPLESFVDLLDQEIKLVSQVLAHGVPAAGLYAALTKNGLDKAPPKKEAQRPGQPLSGQAYKVDIKGAPVKGAKNALVTIVEYGDFQCPFCARVEETLAQIFKRYPHQVRLVWRNLPLPFHGDAKRAAVAAMAAQRRGKFWPMHDLLLEHPTELGDEAILGYAQELKLDMAKFKEALADERISKSIDEESVAAGKVGARGTPSFFINGVFLAGAQSLPQFEALIDEALRKAKALVKKGTPKAKVYDEIMKSALVEVAKPAGDEEEARSKVEIGQSPSRGPADAPVTMVVFSDFQCPFCARMEAILGEVEKAYPGKVRVVWKNFPLSFHARAMVAAEAAMAAHEQGKFWPMQAKLMEHQNALEDTDLEGYAREIGLDMVRFKAAMASHEFAAAVGADVKQASALGVKGAPTTFVNGIMISGAAAARVFKARVDQELAQTTAKQESFGPRPGSP